MATVHHSQQSLTQFDPVVEPQSSFARRDSTRPDHEPDANLRDNSLKTVRLGTAEVQYPVVLRLADASVKPADDEFVHMSPLMVESATESIGSGKSTLASNAQGIAATNTFASLLAASPSLQSTRSVEAPGPSTPEVARQIVSTANTLAPSYQPSPIEPPAPVPAPAPEPPVERTQVQQRIDRPAIKPLRRPFKLTKPAWMPEIPPTLVLGMLICFSALLIGMLWGGNDREAPGKLHPASHDAPVAGEGTAAPPQVATVPKAKRGKRAAAATAARSSEKKVSQASLDRRRRLAEEAKQLESQAGAPAQEIPAPRITGIRPLPPVGTYAQENPYGQPVGGPKPQIVENPHVTGQNAVYEARRPPAQFQGTITPPDAAVTNERF